MTTVDPTVSMTSQPAAPTPAAAGRGWTWAGATGGLVGIAGLMVTGNLYDPATGAVADNDELAAAVTDSAALVWAQQVVTAVVAGCLLVFAAGLRRHLARQEPAGGLLPGLAAAGIAVTAAAVFIGGGMSTEMFWALTGDQPFDPDTVGAHVTFHNTIAWLWGGLGLSAAAVAFGGLRRGSVGRVLAAFSAVMALALLACQALPVQYAAVLPGGLWLVVAGVALAVGGRRPATGRP
jgi:hypothetical protein